MTIDGYNKYIKNYLENDKTQSAIMLTAPWGAGKSYYIKNNLTKFLEKNKLSYAIVSVYGLSSIAEINKELFLEIKFQKSKKLSKHLAAFGKSLATGAIGIGKTLLKNVAKIDIDFDLAEPNYKKLYDLVNLKDKLIIFEDIERTGVNIIEFLGYVNNIVEQDRVKVLLVVNEQELLKKVISGIAEESQITSQDIANKSSDNQQLIEYLRKKEKTISDTIVFETDKKEALKSIINLYLENELTDILVADDTLVKDIINVMITVKSDNLRAVIYACQKTFDMIKECKIELDKDFVRFLLCSIIAYSCRIKKGNDVKWESDQSSPVALGTANFPLYRVCYDYINSHSLIVAKVEETQRLFLRQRKIDENKKGFKKNLDVLRWFYNNTEENVSEAVYEIKELLLKEGGINFSEYGKLANYLIAVRDCISNVGVVEECKHLMIENIRECEYNSDTEQDIMYHDGIELERTEQKKELAEFKEVLLEELKRKKKTIFTLEFSLENVESSIKNIHSHIGEFIENGSFINNINIEDFIELLKKCKAKTINEIRGIFLDVYASANIREFMAEDKEGLKILKNRLQKFEEEFDGYDKIQKKQIEWFIGNLENIIQKLS